MSKPIVIDLSPLHNLENGGVANTDLTDGKHVFITCSSCRKKLCDIWITQPQLEVHTKIIATCDYCGDKSYETDIDGKFHVGITDDSNIDDVQQTFLNGPVDGGIYQKMKILTKRAK
jgi:hypothetical protein